MHTLHCDQLVVDVILINETNHVGPFLTIQEEREPHDIANGLQSTERAHIKYQIRPSDGM